MDFSIYFSFDPWNFDDKKFHWLATVNSNNNNINLSTSLSQHSNNNICLKRRWIIVWMMNFFSLYYFSWKSLALRAFLFFKSIKIIINLPISSSSSSWFFPRLSTSSSVEGHGIALTPWRLALYNNIVYSLYLFSSSVFFSVINFILSSVDRSITPCWGLNSFSIS